MKILFEKEEIDITPTLLLDYGLLYQIIFIESEQTNQFVQKLASCVWNMLINNKKFVSSRVTSKALERDVSGLLAAQHAIYLKSHSLRPMMHNEPWI